MPLDLLAYLLFMSVWYALEMNVPPLYYYDLYVLLCCCILFTFLSLFIIIIIIVIFNYHYYFLLFLSYCTALWSVYAVCKCAL